MLSTRRESGPPPIRVLVVSDIRLYREGIGRLLESEARFRVAAANGSLEAVVADWTPDVVLVDAAMADGVAAIRAVRQASPASRVIVLTVSDVDGQLLRFAEAGIAGYVTRDGSQADLVAAIESVERGEAVCSPRAAAALLERVAVLASEPPPADGRLTARESEILDLLEAGLSNKEIGARLFIGVPTVKTHVHNILKKLGASRRGEAAARARAGV